MGGGFDRSSEEAATEMPPDPSGGAWQRGKQYGEDYAGKAVDKRSLTCPPSGAPPGDFIVSSYVQTPSARRCLFPIVFAFVYTE